MPKILIVEDSKSWAIGKLTNVIDNFNRHLKIKQIEIHPKELRNNPEENIAKFEKEVLEFQPDIIHFQYWDIANTLSKSNVCRNKRLILTHHNQKNLLTHDWKNFDAIVVHTQKAKEILEKAGYWNVEVIQHGIDVEKFKYGEYDFDTKMLGYTGRVVPWKGLLEILKLAKELKTEVIMQGHVDKPDYWKKCLEFEEQMDIRFNTPDSEQTEVYHEMACYIGNSIDGVEEGTLGLLEAMACGVPVITTPSGEAKDIIKNGENGILVDFEDYESLKKGVNLFFGMTKEEKNEMREKAWNTVKMMNQEVMARKYEKLYYKFYPQDLVSVIIPTYKRADTLKQVLDGYARQTYQPIELVVVVDDILDYDYENLLTVWREENNIPIKWDYTNCFDEYGLAKSRNMGIFMSSGHYLVFNDDRYVPEREAVEIFISVVKKTKTPIAVWGDKGAGKRDFMENFFAVRKKHIADAGMFNERGNEYGFQSQEIRERLRSLKFDLIYEPLAKASVLFGTHNKSSKRYEILHSKTKLWKLKN